jgi:hypothetical protein
MSKKVKTIEEEIKSAMTASVEESDGVDDLEVVEEPESEVTEPAEQPEEKATESELKPEVEKPTVEQPENKPAVDAPVSLSGAIKAKWKDLPDDVRAEWKKREDDVHRMMTAHDGELRLGRSVKEIASPYEAMIRSEGGTVEGAFKDLLNTAYILRTASPQQKAQLIMNTAQQFGVDLKQYIGVEGNAQPQNQQNSQFAALQEEIHRLKQQANPETIKNQLQEEMTRDRITSEIQTFAANPANVHFEAVRTLMGTLISSGQAKNLQDAYEKAIWSTPDIRSELLKSQNEELAKKKKAEIEAKKKAAVSVTGSPSMASPSAKTPTVSIEDDIREQLRAATGAI